MTEAPAKIWAANIGYWSSKPNPEFKAVYIRADIAQELAWLLEVGTDPDGLPPSVGYGEFDRRVKAAIQRAKEAGL